MSMMMMLVTLKATQADPISESYGLPQADPISESYGLPQVDFHENEVGIRGK